MSKMVVSIHFSYDMRSDFGYAHCTSCETFIDSIAPLRDIENVEKAVALMKKFFSKKNLNGKEIRLSYFDIDSSMHHCDVSTIYTAYIGANRDIEGYEYIIHEGRGAFSNVAREKMTAKDFREFYLNACDCAIAYKEEQELERKKALERMGA